jgi:hypothetical protein
MSGRKEGKKYREGKCFIMSKMKSEMRKKNEKEEKGRNIEKKITRRFRR